MAATTYHLLTGRQLFPHSNPAVVIGRHLNATPPTLADTHPHFADLDAVLAVALAKDPNDRFPRGADFARALQRAATSGAASASAPTAPAPAAGKPDQRASVSGLPRRWLVAAATVGVLCLAGAIGLVWRPWQQPRSHNTATSTATSAATTTTSPPASISLAPPSPPPPPTSPTTVTTQAASGPTLGEPCSDFDKLAYDRMPARTLG
jgi:serine/threonine-protein kinase